MESTSNKKKGTIALLAAALDRGEIVPGPKLEVK